MTFKEFEERLHSEVSNFLMNYAEEMQADPETFPSEYGSVSDWWEQFELARGAE